MTERFYTEETTFLGIPGPVEVHPRVMQAMNKHLYGHRTDHFREIISECGELFKPTIQTAQEVYFLAGSGSLGLHAGISNLVDRSDTVLNLSSGKFGERVIEITKRFTDRQVSLTKEYGQAIKPEDVKVALEDNPETTLVTMTHNETSTSVLNPLPEISRIVHDHGALLMADCITSAGGDEVRMDEWGIDFFVSGSQKCYGVPAGLAFVSFSEAAAQKMEGVSRDQDYYADLLMFREKYGKNHDTPFTPAVSLIYGLRESLRIIEEEGMENRIARHRKMGELYRSAMRALGVELLAEEGYYSNTVTASLFPDGVDPKRFMQACLDLGLLAAGGQGSLKNRIWRLGHMNVVGPREILSFVSVVEYALRKAGHEFEPGTGVGAVLKGL